MAEICQELTCALAAQTSTTICSEPTKRLHRDEIDTKWNPRVNLDSISWTNEAKYLPSALQLRCIIFSPRLLLVSTSTTECPMAAILSTKRWVAALEHIPWVIVAGRQSRRSKDSHGLGWNHRRSWNMGIHSFNVTISGVFMPSPPLGRGIFTEDWQ
jgi:hypothetical protein